MGYQMSRRRSRTARNAFGCFLAAFVTCQVLLFWVIEEGWPQLRDPAYAVRIAALKQRLRTAKKTGQPELVVMLGSSRTLNALRASPLEASLSDQAGRPVLVQNLGVPAAGPMTGLLYFGRMLAEGIRPDLVLIEVMPLFLDRKAGSSEVWIEADRLGWHDFALMEQYALPSRALWDQWRDGCFLPGFKHRSTILNEAMVSLWPRYRAQHWSHRCDATGWMAQPREDFPPDAVQQVQERARTEYESKLCNFELGGHSCEALRRLLTECEREQIPTALVLMPEATMFQRWYPQEAWQAIESFVAEVSRQHHRPVINARNWIADEDFLDGHHLLNRGATAFTQRLADAFLRDALTSLQASWRP
jgi:hypothetical protein